MGRSFADLEKLYGFTPACMLNEPSAHGEAGLAGLLSQSARGGGDARDLIGPGMPAPSSPPA
jgi:hypothetical protein